MAEENEKEIKSDGAKVGGGAKSSPLVVLLIVLNCATLGFVGFQQYQFMKKSSEEPNIRDVVSQMMDERGSEDSQSELIKEKKEEGSLLPLENFTVNLAQGTGPRRYLRMKTVLQFNKDAKDEEFQARKPQIRDAIISILNSKKPEDLLQREGKLFLKEEIKNAVNSFLINGAVVDIYYVSFQIN